MKLFKNYNKPTPLKWKRIGDAILYGCGAIGATGLFAFDKLQEIYSPKELKIIIGIVMVLGFVGKFLISFFKGEDPTPTE